MFTIDDLRGQFNIEGAIKVMKYNSDAPLNEEYELCYQQENGTSYDIPNEYCHTEITYMYSKDNYLVIELSEEK